MNSILTHDAQEQRLTALLDDTDSSYWGYSDALDAAWPDLPELHRILKDAMREAAQSGYDLAKREIAR